jgi:hypothetical protein
VDGRRCRKRSVRWIREVGSFPGVDGVSPTDLRKKRRGHLKEERGWKEKEGSEVYLSLVAMPTKDS